MIAEKLLQLNYIKCNCLQLFLIINVEKLLTTTCGITYYCLFNNTTIVAWKLSLADFFVSKKDIIYDKLIILQIQKKLQEPWWVFTKFYGLTLTNWVKNRSVKYWHKVTNTGISDIEENGSKKIIISL